MTSDTPIIENNRIDPISNELICWKCSGKGFKPKKQRYEPKICTVCNGMGIESVGVPKPFKRPIRQFKPKDGYEIIGPAAKKRIDDPEVQPGDGEMLTSLCGFWMIYQIQQGHRSTTDDFVVAYTAIKEGRRIGSSFKYIDIGTGLGTILNIVNWSFGARILHSIGFEAQMRHVSLCKKTIEFNGVPNCQVIHGDLRDVASGNMMSLEPHSYSLITGSPPYFIPKVGPLSKDLGRSLCAFELRGGIEVYCNAASRLLERSCDARFVCSQTALEIRRTETAGRTAGFKVLSRLDVHGICGKPPLFSVFVFGWADECSDSDYLVETMFIRGEDGQYTEDIHTMYGVIGKPPPSFEPHSIPSRLRQTNTL